MVIKHERVSYYYTPEVEDKIMVDVGQLCFEEQETFITGIQGNFLIVDPPLKIQDYHGDKTRKFNHLHSGSERFYYIPHTIRPNGYEFGGYWRYQVRDWYPKTYLEDG